MRVRLCLHARRLTMPSMAGTDHLAHATILAPVCAQTRQWGRERGLWTKHSSILSEVTRRDRVGV